MKNETVKIISNISGHPFKIGSIGQVIDYSVNTEVEQVWVQVGDSSYWVLGADLEALQNKSARIDPDMMQLYCAALQGLLTCDSVMMNIHTEQDKYAQTAFDIAIAALDKLRGK
jgi:hypothetical protein